MTRRRKRRPQKPDQRAKARWMASRGYPFAYIATTLAVHRNSITRWCTNASDNRTLDRLAARVRSLTRVEYRELMERVSAKRAA